MLDEKVFLKLNIKELKKLEKQYFDTYKTKRSNIDKANHLIEMANIIKRIEHLENKVK